MNAKNVKNVLKLPAGTVIDGKFEITSNPVRRSFGVAYLAVNLETHQNRTLLFLPPVISADREAMEYIQDETKLIRWVKHPFIAKLYELHSEGELAYFELEYVRGKNLREKKVSNEDKRLSENIVKWLGVQILDALEYAHDQNILHKDIKPQNVVITPDGEIKLIDFGISETLRYAVSLIRDTSAQTTILYMSPEQVRGRQMSVQADIYSVAATMYDLAGGKPPFSHGDVYTQILREPVKPIHGISQVFNQILLKGLAKKPLDRYSSCRAMKDDLMRSGVRFPKNAEETQAQLESKEIKEEEEKFKFKFFSLNPTLKYMFWTILIAGAVLFITAKFNQISTLLQSADSLQTAADLDSVQIKLAAALLQAGKDNIAQQRFYTPEGSNALEMFRRVLKIDPANKEALSYIDALKQRFITQAKDFVIKNQADEARQIIDQGLEYYPQDSELLEYKQSIPAFKAKIAVLNGAGIKGIANVMKDALRDNGWTVSYTENYRVNGRINWRVTRTRFIGKTAENQQTKRISSQIGLSYQKAPSDTEFPAGTNLLIILGRDYSSLPAFR